MTDPTPGLTIAEAAERTGLTTHTLRYYERDGLMLGAVDRSASGHRRYTERDLAWIEMITRLRSTGMPIREVRTLRRPGPRRRRQRGRAARPAAWRTGCGCWRSWPR